MTDLSAHDAILLWRERIVKVLTDVGCTDIRAAGWAAADRPMPSGVPIELWVTLNPATEQTTADLAQLDQQLTALLGHPVVVSGVPPHRMTLLPGERVLYL